MKKKLLIAILLFASIFQTILFIKTFDYFTAVEDTRTYVNIAKNISAHNIYSKGEIDSSGNLVPTAFPPPIVPYFYSTLYSLLGIEMGNLIGRFVHFFMNLGIIFLSYKIGKLFNFYTGCIAAILATFDLSMFYWSSFYFLADTTLTLFMALSLFYFFKLIKQTLSLQNIILCSIFLGLAALSKPIVYLLFIPLSIFLLIYFKSQGFEVRKIVKYVGIFLIIQTVFIGGWSTRNYVATDYFTFSAQQGTVILFYNAVYLKAYQEGSSWEETKEIFNNLYNVPTLSRTEGERNVYWKKIAMKMILDDPIGYAAVVLRGIPKMLLGTVPPDFLFSIETKNTILDTLNINKFLDIKGDEKTFFVMKKTLEILWERGYYKFPVFWGLIKLHIVWIYLLSGIGFIIFFIKGSSTDKWAILGGLLFVSYICIIASPTSHGRYRAPIMPVFYIFCSYTMTYLSQIAFKKQGIKYS